MKITTTVNCLKVTRRYFLNGPRLYQLASRQPIALRKWRRRNPAKWGTAIAFDAWVHNAEWLARRV